MNIRISFQVNEPYALTPEQRKNGMKWRRHKWHAGQKANGGMEARSGGGYVLRMASNPIGMIQWEWDYKGQGEFIEYGTPFFPCP